ncbi:hypothetical protein IEQ34_021727 [Dendrobium chrysotoxum]|uniref:Uncharacterized protein n=1 Tax=Dendrobium chrysotoxum TaxID=161865 RepID=A0AAV7FN28_DENCH|nr:hypothetical protein IEQ34_021727 [Dendrobium chrysotoxum]
MNLAEFANALALLEKKGSGIGGKLGGQWGDFVGNYSGCNGHIIIFKFPQLALAVQRGRRTKKQKAIIG